MKSLKRAVKVVSLAAAWLLSPRMSLAAEPSGRGGAGAGAGTGGARGTTTGIARVSTSGESLAQAIARREEWRRSRAAMLLDDFGETAHFRAANAALKPPGPGEVRVVFLGDSITAAWALPLSFPGKPYVNRGIGGQTTSQVLVRFRQDVIDLKPAVVVILLGTNDIAGNTGPIAPGDIEQNLGTMAELARANGIAVVLSSVVPVHNYTPASALAFPLRPPAQIVELNRWLSAYAVEHGHVYLDYFGAMIDDHGLLRKELGADGLHPDQAGYAIMTRLAAAAIERALAGSAGRASPTAKGSDPARTKSKQQK